MIAASNEGHLAVVEVLVCAGAEDGTTTLIAASAEGHLVVVQALLSTELRAGAGRRCRPCTGPLH